MMSEETAYDPAAAGEGSPPGALILAIGSEVVQGRTIDANSAWLSLELQEMGFEVVGHRALPDRQPAIEAELRRALGEGLLVVGTGGIGPTVDDRTRQAAAAALKKPLQLDHAALHALQERYSAVGRVFPEGSEIQCMAPAGAELVPNPFGTASCFVAEAGGGVLVVLPGVPREMKGVWREEMRPRLAERFGLRGPPATRELRVFGIPESDLNNRVTDLLESPGSGVEASILVDDAVIRLRWMHRAGGEEGEARLEALIADARARLGDLVYAGGEISLEEAAVRALAARGWRAATAESCTGGMIGHLLTQVPGSSAVYSEGFIAYSNDAKTRLLGVRQETLARHGAVSEETAREMIRGLMERSGADIGVAVTGIAGPDGGTPEKPVGTVWLAAAAAGGERAWRLSVPGDRELVKWRTARTALNVLRLAAAHGALPETPARFVAPPA